MMATRDSDWTKMFSRRAMILGGAQAAMVATLVGRMYYLQVVQADRYRTLADENRITTVLLPPPRGRILDRFGQPLAYNKQQFQAMVIPEQAPGISATLDVLAQLIDLPEHERERIKKDVGRKRAFVPITIKQNLTWEEMARIQVNAPDLPGLVVEQGLTRAYTQSEAAAHLLGYVSSVDEADLTGDPLLQLPGFRVGKAGVEKIYDLALRGKGGTSEMEINAVGRGIRELERQEGEPGADVVLTIDDRLQNFAFERMKVEESASINVMDIYTGEMLVMASNPSFDPHLFARGVSAAEWKDLSTNTRGPLTNKAIAGHYPPGSTFKVCVALAALEYGVIAADQTVHCAGQTRLGSRTWFCWKKGGHGALDMANAITQSCDCYFYEVARRLGVDRMAAVAHKLNLGELTGVGLPNEQKGLIPTEAWKKAATREPWQPGETLNVGIGQGQVTITPIQLVTYMARIANGGLAVKPTLIRAPEKNTGAANAVHDGADEAPAAARSLDSLGFPTEHLAVIQRGMFGCVNSPGGTALQAALKMQDPDKRDWKMAGKTGSSQTHSTVNRSARALGEVKQETLDWELRDHGLFIAFAPFHAPRYAAACVIEHGKAGVNAALIVKDVMEKVLELDPSRKPRMDEFASAQSKA
jgi:penicillin-binding protein 2